MGIKVLLVNAINPFSEVQYRFPNLGLGYLAASLRCRFGRLAANTFDIRIVDHGIETEIDRFCPDVVGITSVTQNYGFACQYARAAKKRNIPVIMGGVHISALTESMTEDMDIAVIGEGEETFAELIEIYLNYGGFPIKELVRAKGISFWFSDGNLHYTQNRDLIEPIDNIPPPARDLLHIRAQSNIFSSRGCPYRCSFCFSSRYWHKVRFFSAEYVAEELRQMASMGIKRVNFYDDIMIADPKRLEKLWGIIQLDPVLYKLKFWINARANLVTDNTARILSEMHVVSVGLGLESGNDRTLKYLKGDTVSVADNYNAIQNLHRYGISATASFVIGSPDETEDEILDTYRFIAKSGLDFVDTFVLVPFPGTPVWEYAKSIGAVNERGMDWNRFNVYYLDKKNPILVSSHITKEKMDQIYKKFHHQRLFLAAKKAWFHPFFTEMCKAGAKKLVNRIRGFGCHPRSQLSS